MKLLRSLALLGTLCAALPCVQLAAAPAAPRLNVLVITSDDMSCDSVGVYGCKLKGTTPNIDRGPPTPKVLRQAKRSGCRFC